MEQKAFLFTIIPIALVILVFGYLNLQQNNISENNLQPGDLCKSIEYNGKDRIDILFISSEQEAKDYTEELLNTEPYKEYRNYFNTYVISEEVECKDYKGIAILCNTKEVQDLAKKCPSDYVVVVKEEPANIRSSAYGNILSINKVHGNVIIHEMGHAFGNLAEEYGGARLPSGSKNCLSSCDKFKLPIDSCELECSSSSYYRSIPSGVMRTLITDNYGIYNIALLTELLQKNKPEETSVTGMNINAVADLNQECNNNVLSVEITQSNEETTATTDNVLQTGCAPEESGTGSLCIGDNCYPNLLFTDSQTESQETIEGEALIPQDSLIYNIKQDPTSPLVNVVLDGETIATIDTAQAGATACLI